MVSSANYIARPRHIPEKMQSDCVPRMKLTARKSTHYLTEQEACSAIGRIKRGPVDHSDQSPSEIQRSLLCSTFGFNTDSISKSINIPAESTSRKPPLTSAFKKTKHLLSVGCSAADSDIPSVATPSVFPRARKSLPFCSNLPRYPSASTTLRYALLQSLADPLFKAVAPSCSNHYNSKGVITPEQRNVFYCSEQIIGQASDQKPTIKSVNGRLRHVSPNVVNEKTVPLVIIDPSLKMVQDEDFEDSSAIIFLNNEDSLIFEQPNNFMLAKNTSDSCRPERFASSTVKSENLNNSDALTKSTEMPPVLLEMWPEPPSLLLQSEAGDDDGMIEMPPLLLPTGDKKESEDRELSRSPEMPILTPVDFQDMDTEKTFDMDVHPITESHPLLSCHNGRYQRRPRRRGLPLAFRRQCPRRTIQTEAYFQGRYAFMAGKKLRDPNYQRGMGTVKRLGSGRGPGRPPLSGVKMLRRPRGRGRGRPRIHRGECANRIERNPHIDVVDGVEFLSFETEQDLKWFMKTHPSYTLDVSKLRDEDLLKIPLDSRQPLGDAVFASNSQQMYRIRGEPIVLTKTKDITQIKGWRYKVFANCQNPAVLQQGNEEYVAAERKRMQLVERFISKGVNKNYVPPNNSEPAAIKVEPTKVTKISNLPTVSEPAPAIKELAKSTDSANNAKSAFVSDYLDEFLRMNSELKIGAAATLSNEYKQKEGGEIDTKVVWPTKDDYPLQAPLPTLEENYPFVLAPPVKPKRMPGRPPLSSKQVSVRVQEAERVKRKYTRRAPLKTAVEVKKVDMETPSYLKTDRPVASAAVQTAPKGKVTIDAVTMSMTDAQFAVIALVSPSYWRNTVDSLPPLEEIGRMCKRTEDNPEVLRKNARMASDFTVVMDQKHVISALHVLKSFSGANPATKNPDTPNILSKEFHDLSAEEKWEKMMNYPIDEDPYSILQDLDPEAALSNKSKVDTCSPFTLDRTLGAARVSIASKNSPAFASEAPTIACKEPAVDGSRCVEPHCQLGCICSSLKAMKKRRRKHCGRTQCMLACNCRETDALQARTEEDKAPELPTKRRREIRLPARLKDSVCMWNQASIQDSINDEDFSLSPPAKKRGKYNTKKQKELASRMALWKNPSNVKVPAAQEKKQDLVVEEPHFRSSQSARKQFIARKAMGEVTPTKSQSYSARKGFLVGRRITDVSLPTTTSTGARKGHAVMRNAGSEGSLKQMSYVNDRLNNIPPNSKAERTKPSNERPSVLLPARRLLYNPDGTIAGVLRPAASAKALAQGLPCHSVQPPMEESVLRPPPKKTARKSVSTPFNQRKMLDQMNAAKLAQQDKQSSTEEIIKDVVNDVLRKVTINLELENVLTRHQGILPKSSRARMSCGRPSSQPKEVAKESVPTKANKKDDREKHKRAKRAHEESNRRHLLRKGFQQLSNLIEPEEKPFKKANMRDLVNMARIAIRQLRCDQQSHIEIKRKLINRRVQLFEKYGKLLKNMNPVTREESIEDLADGLQTLAKRREMKGPLTLEKLNRLTMPTGITFNSVAREDMDREFIKSCMNDEDFPPDANDSDLSESDTEMSDDQTPNALADSNENYLKQTLNEKPPGPQLNINPRNWPPALSALWSGNPSKNSKTTVMKTVRLRPPGSAPSWIPLHEAPDHWQPGRQKLARNLLEKAIVQQSGTVRTFKVATQTSNKTSPSAPKGKRAVPIFALPLGPFQKPRILQRAKVQQNGSSAKSDSVACDAVSSKRDYSLNIAPLKPVLTIKPVSSASLSRPTAKLIASIGGGALSKNLTVPMLPGVAPQSKRAKNQEVVPIIKRSNPLPGNESVLKQKTAMPINLGSLSILKPLAAPVILRSSSVAKPEATPVILGSSSVAKSEATPVILGSPSVAKQMAMPVPLGSSSVATPVTLGSSSVATPVTLGSSSVATPVTLGSSSVATPVTIGSSSVAKPLATAVTLVSSSVAKSVATTVTLGSSSVAKSVTTAVTAGSSSVAKPVATAVILGSSSVAKPLATAFTLGSSSVAKPVAIAVTLGSSSVAKPLVTAVTLGSSSVGKSVTTAVTAGSSSVAKPLATAVTLGSSSVAKPGATAVTAGSSPVAKPVAIAVTASSSSVAKPGATAVTLDSSPVAKPVATPQVIDNASSSCLDANNGSQLVNSFLVDDSVVKHYTISATNPTKNGPEAHSQVIKCDESPSTTAALSGNANVSAVPPKGPFSQLIRPKGPTNCSPVIRKPPNLLPRLTNSNVNSVRMCSTTAQNIVGNYSSPIVTKPPGLILSLPNSNMNSIRTCNTTTTTSQSIIGVNGKSIPLFCTLPKSNTMSSLANLNQKAANTTTTLLIGVIPTATGSTPPVTSTSTTSSSVMKAVAKPSGDSDKVTPIMAISLPSTTASITLDGKKVCFIKPGARIVSKNTTSITSRIATTAITTSLITTTTAAPLASTILPATSLCNKVPIVTATSSATRPTVTVTPSVPTTLTTVSTEMAAVTTSASPAIAAVPARTTTVSATIAAVPARTTTASATIAAVPARTSTVSATIAAVPARTTTASATIAAVPARTTTASATIAAVSARTTTVSATIAAVPARTTTVSETVAAVPVRTMAAAATIAAVPVRTTTTSAFLKPPLPLEKFRFVATVLRTNNPASSSHQHVMKENSEIKEGNLLFSAEEIVHDDVPNFMTTAGIEEVCDISELVRTIKNGVHMTKATTKTTTAASTVTCSTGKTPKDIIQINVGESNCSDISALIKAKNVDLARVSANPELQITEIRNKNHTPNMTETGETNTSVLQNGAEMAYAEIPSVQDELGSSDANRSGKGDENISQDGQDPNQSTSTVEEIEFDNISSPEIVVINSKKSAGSSCFRSKEIMTKYDNLQEVEPDMSATHERLLASLKELTVVRLPPKLPCAPPSQLSMTVSAADCTSRPEDTPVGSAEAGGWPKIIAFSSISEDEFLCKEVEGKDEDLMIIEEDVGNLAGVQNLGFS